MRILLVEDEPAINRQLKQTAKTVGSGAVNSSKTGATSK
jgi:DNA-binding response OmpR family regulator